MDILKIAKHEGIQLRRVDNTHFIKNGCPFCGSLKAAFYPLTGVFRCKKCRTIAGPLSFVMKMKKMDYMETWNYLNRAEIGGNKII